VAAAHETALVQQAAAAHDTAVAAAHETVVAQQKPPTPAPPPPSNPCGNIPAHQSASVSPGNNCVAAGREAKFTIVGHGFTPGEVVGAYGTEPDGSVYGQIQVEADGNGDVLIYWTIYGNAGPGVYAETMEGVYSHHKAIAYARVH
jgi:hypothetical protein